VREQIEVRIRGNIDNAVVTSLLQLHGDITAPLR
jgi:hypothetical protein